MIALDTNLLVYAHRSAAPEHRSARRAIERASADRAGWGVGAATLAEFWAVVTHPSIERPSTGAEAHGFCAALFDAGAQVWVPGAGFGDRLLRAAAELGVQGVRIFDLQIAMTAFEGGAREIWTRDRGFVSIPGLRVVDPF